MGKLLVLVGLVLAGLGLLIMAGLPLGRLPGDIYLKRENFTVYLPITTSILLSIVLTVILSLFRR